MRDRVIVSGIRFHARHGATRLEREIGVRYSVTLEMTTDLSASMESDRLEDTVDYARVHAVVMQVAREKSVRLMEKLAATLAHRVLEAFDVEEVRVRIRKETPVLDGIVDWVGVDISRRRDALPAGRSSSA